MKLGISMYSYVRAVKAGTLDWPGFIREAARLGAPGVELLDFFYTGLDISETRAAALNALAETGLECGVFSVAQNFAKLMPEDRALELDKIKFGVDEAGHFGAKVVRVFAGDLAPGITLDVARPWVIEGLAAASKYAAERGVRLALENHGKLAGRSDQIVEIIRDVRQASGTDALWANPDTGNFLLVDQAPETAIREVAPLAAMVHFKDFGAPPENYDGHRFSSLGGKEFAGTVIGEGDVNLVACVEELTRVGFDGWVNLEYEANGNPIVEVETSYANARAVIG